MSVIDKNFDKSMKDFLGIEEQETERIIEENIKNNELKELVLQKQEPPSDLVEILESSGDSEAVAILEQQGMIKRQQRMFDNLETNYTETRSHLTSIMEHGIEALSVMRDEVAPKAESVREATRVYEVMATLIKAVSDASSKQIELDEKVFNMTGLTDRIKSENMIERHNRIGNNKNKHIGQNVNIQNMMVTSTKGLGQMIRNGQLKKDE